MFKRTLSIVQLAFAILTFQASAEPPIQDPIADYLAMNVPDRATNVGRLLVIKEVAIDMEGNGKDDLFVGTWYRNSGPNTWLWAGYAPVTGGYERITPADSDVLIDFDRIRWVTSRILVDTDWLRRTAWNSIDKIGTDRILISDVTFYYIEEGRLMQQGTGTLDRDDPEQESKFEYYFGPNRKISAPPKIESFTVPELVERGYHIPVWRSLKPSEL